MPHFDIVVIGSGAGGATLAQRLAPTGKSILILERGEHVPREAENWSPKSVFIQHRYRTQEKWYDKAGHPFTPNCHYWVGGNTTFYGAALFRLRKGDFDQTQHAEHFVFAAAESNDHHLAPAQSLGQAAAQQNSGRSFSQVRARRVAALRKDRRQAVLGHRIPTLRGSLQCRNFPAVFVP